MVDTVGNVNPTFHVVFRDDFGVPAKSGSVETFKDSARGTHKATYQDRARTIPLSNPIALNAAGIVSKSPSDGTPVPMYLSDDENYYMVVRDSLGTIIQTIPAWNADNAFSTKPQFDEIVTTNFIPNAQFRSLVNGKTLYSSDDLNATNNILIARDNWYLRRDVLTSTNIIEFKEFVPGQTDVPFNSKYYLNFSCSVASTEITKDITVDIGDVETFSNQEMTFAIYGRSSTLSTIEIIADQDFGSGGSTQELKSVDTFQLTSSFAQYSTTFTVLDVSSATIKTDNKFRIRIRVPLNAICNIDFVMCQLNFGNTVLQFDFQPSIMNDGNVSKDAIPQPTKTDAFKSLTLSSDSVTNIWASNPPVGSTIGFAGNTSPDGWLKCDNDSYSGIIETIYGNLYDAIGNKYGYGADGFYSLNYNDDITVQNTKKDTNVTDIADGNTGFTFSTVTQGSDLGFYTFTPWDETTLSVPGLLQLSQYDVIVRNKNNGAVTAASAQTSGFTILIAEGGSPSTPEVTYITPTAATGLAGKYFFISSVTTDYYFWFEESGSGADPAIGGRTGIKIAVNTGDTLLNVYGAIFFALGGCEQSKIICNAASTLTAGDYFLIYNSTDTFVPWYRIGGAGTEPAIVGTKCPIDVDGADTATQVATKTRNSLARIFFQTPKQSGYFARGYDDGAGIDPNSATRFPTPGFTEAGDNVGTLQRDQVGPIGVTAPIWTQSGSPLFQSGAGEIAALQGLAVGTETRPLNYYEMRIIKY